MSQLGLGDAAAAEGVPVEPPPIPGLEDDVDLEPLRPVEVHRDPEERA